MTAKLLSEACHNISTVPSLQPLTGESLTHVSANTGPVKGIMCKIEHGSCSLFVFSTSSGMDASTVVVY